MGIMGPPPFQTYNEVRSHRHDCSLVCLRCSGTRKTRVATGEILQY